MPPRPGAFRSFLTLARWVLASAVASVTLASLQFGQARTAELRQISSQNLTRFDDEKMWLARNTLRKFYQSVNEVLKDSDPRFPAKLVEISETCIAFVYALQSKLPAECPPKDGLTGNAKEAFYHEVDRSRRMVKNFYENIIELVNQDLLTSSAVERFVTESTIDFLDKVWLPVEHGQNQALYGKAAEKNARSNEKVDWYRKQLKKLEDAKAIRSQEWDPGTY